MSTARERFCCVCGRSIGKFEDKHYDRRDTCGARDCDSEMRDAEQAERQEAHEQLDRDRGWS